MDDKSLPYNLRLRKDHKGASASTEHSKHQKQERDFQGAGEEGYGGHLAVNYKCEKCGCSFDFETSLHSHHCRKKNEKEAMENQVQESLGEKNTSRKRSRKGIPIRAPFF